MKKSLRLLLLPVFFAGFLALTLPAVSQAPPPPPNSGSKGDDTNKGPGGGAALAGGLGAAAALIAGYAVWKWYSRRRSVKC